MTMLNFLKLLPSVICNVIAYTIGEDIVQFGIAVRAIQLKFPIVKFVSSR